jgi:hypothetical protein
MKKLIGLIAVCASLAVLALPALANVALSTNVAEQAQGGCTDENKAAWYKTFIDNYKTNATAAYEAAKKYLASCAKDDEAQTQYLKKWVGAYEKEVRKSKLPVLLFTDKKYAEAYALGKEILADEPENLTVLMELGYGGYFAAISKVDTFNADAIGYAKKAIQLVESGKAPENWAPFSGKDEALGYLNYTIGVLTVQKNPAEALPYLIKAAQVESKLKKLPSTYSYIAAAYEAGPYATMSAEYKTKHEGKDETPESKLALENINQVVDRMIDSYARAVALATDPKEQASKTEWMQNLSTWYKFRHNQSDAGLNEMIASVLAKPLPPQPTLLTTLPASGPASTPASGSVNSASGSTAAGGVANKPAAASSNTASTSPPMANQPTKINTAENATPPASAKPSATPKPSPTPTKPRSRKNHRRG